MLLDPSRPILEQGAFDAIVHKAVGRPGGGVSRLQILSSSHWTIMACDNRTQKTGYWRCSQMPRIQRSAYCTLISDSCLNSVFSEQNQQRPQLHQSVAVACVSPPSPYRTEWEQLLLAFRRAHPHVPIIDPPERVRLLHDRSTMLAPLRHGITILVSFTSGFWWCVALVLIFIVCALHINEPPCRHSRRDPQQKNPPNIPNMNAEADWYCMPSAINRHLLWTHRHHMMSRAQMASASQRQLRSRCSQVTLDLSHCKRCWEARQRERY